MRLQASQLGRSARFGNLPLYLVLGETGSAKTSVVLHSGLEPELLAGQTVQDKVPVPTRTANLWYTRQFIFAEAGGPMLQDRPRWAKLVKKLAPRQLHSVFGKGTPSPRAALVCVDCESFMKAGAPEALAASIERIRTRLREVSQLLGISLPVYVLFTRADRLQFFQDYVRNLTNDEASVVFGATLPMVTYSTGVYAEQETARVSGAFDNLFQSLADRRVNLLSQEFDATKLPTIYEFPREFRKLRTLLVQLLVDLCRPSQLRTGPFLRGFYFSGVRPVTITTAGPTLAREEPIAQPSAPSGDVGATGIFDIRKARAMTAQQAQAPEVGETRRVPQWVFLPHVFSDVLLKDSSALAASASSTKTSLWRRILLATAMVFLLIFIIGFIVSFVRNKNLESQVVTAAQGISDVQLTGQQLPSLDMLNKLETLRQSVETLSDYQQNGRALQHALGIVRGEFPLSRCSEDLLPAFPATAVWTGAGESGADSFLASRRTRTQRSIWARLRYLEGLPHHHLQSRQEHQLVPFTGPHESLGCRPGHRSGPCATGSKAVRLLQRAVENSRTLTPRSMTRWWSPERAITSPSSRAVERVYRFMLAEADKANPSINFNKKFPGSAEVVVDRTEVSGAFTKGGWTFMQNALQNLPKYFSGEQWVLGQESSSNVDLAKLATDLRSQISTRLHRAMAHLPEKRECGPLQRPCGRGAKALEAFRQSVAAPGPLVRRGSEHGGRPTRCCQGVPACPGGRFTQLPGSIYWRRQQALRRGSQWPPGLPGPGQQHPG